MNDCVLFLSPAAARHARQSIVACFLATATVAAQVQWTPGGKAHLPSDIDATRVLAHADVDGDGDADLIVGNATRNRLYLNQGHGVFTDASNRIPVYSDFTSAIAVGDVDGDGDLDFLAGNQRPPFGQQDRLYVNDGTGRFTAHARLGGVTSTTDLVLADVDGDGDLDAVAADFGTILFGGQNRLYVNDGAGRFTRRGLPARRDYTNAVSVGDVDGDGDNDLVFGNQGGRNGSSQTRLYRNTGSGNFSDATAGNVPTDSDQTIGVALVDIEGDGDLDVVLANVSRPYLKLYVNDGSGRFTDATSGRMPVLQLAPSALAIDDVDGDADPDLVTGHRIWGGSTYVGVQNRLWLNDGTGRFADGTQARMPAIADTTATLLLADIDGDGDRDLVTGNDRQANTLALNDGQGRFQDASQLPMAADSNLATSMAIGDLDGDGDPDAVVGTWAREENQLLLNDGRGTFHDATATGMPGRADVTAAVALGDVDLDGDLDIALGNSGPNVWYLNDGTGRFALGGGFGPSVRTNALVFVDVDGDGDLDIVAANGGGGSPSNQDRLYLNVGRFIDRTGSRMPVDDDESMAVLAADVDRDGDPDLLFGTRTRDRLYLNDGAGRFTDATALRMPAGGGGSFALALADVDGDGDDDLLLGGVGYVRLYLNDGTGRFTDATAQRMPAVRGRVTGLAAGDVDGDGDADVVVGTGGFQSGALQQNVVLLNDGLGFFADATGRLLIARLDGSSAVALVDVDRDRDLDLLVANYGQQNQLYENLERALRFPWLARAGGLFRIDVHGRRRPIRPSQPALILLSAGTTPPVTIPPFGSFGLDLATTVVLPPVFLGGSGTYTATFLLPDNPGLVGSMFFAQALVFHGPSLLDARLTNLVAETIAR